MKTIKEKQEEEMSKWSAGDTFVVKSDDHTYYYMVCVYDMVDRGYTYYSAVLLNGDEQTYGLITQNDAGMVTDDGLNVATIGLNDSFSSVEQLIDNFKKSGWKIKKVNLGIKELPNK